MRKESCRPGQDAAGSFTISIGHWATSRVTRRLQALRRRKNRPLLTIDLPRVPVARARDPSVTTQPTSGISPSRNEHPATGARLGIVDRHVAICTDIIHSISADGSLGGTLALDFRRLAARRSGWWRRVSQSRLGVILPKSSSKRCTWTQSLHDLPLTQ